MIKVGPFWPTLEEEFAKDFSSAQRPIIIAPSRAMLRRLQRILAEKFPVVWNVPFLTIDQLVGRLSAETEVHRIITDDDLLACIVRDIIDKNRLFFQSIGSIAFSADGARAIYAVLRDLNDANFPVEYDYDEVMEILREGRHVPADELDRASEIIALYIEFRKRLALLELATGSDTYRAAAESHAKFLSNFDRVLVYGFYDFTQLQLDLFKFISKKAATTFFFPARPRKPAYEFTTKRLQYMSGLALKVETLDCQENFVCGMFSDSQPGNKPEITFISAATAEEEAWRVAKEIRVPGISLDRVAIVARSLSEYGPLLESAMRSEGIPYVISGNVSLAGNPVVRLFMNLICLNETGFMRDTVVDIFGSPHFARPCDSGKIAMVARWTGIGSGIDSWRMRLSPFQRKDFVYSRGREEDETAVEFRIESPLIAEMLKTLDEIESDLAALPNSASWSEFSNLSMAFLRKWIRPSRVRDHLEQALQMLKNFDVLDTASRAKFLEALAQKCDSLSERGDLDANSGVTILDAQSARGLIFDAVFVVGLAGKIFPPVIPEDPFLSDAVRARIEHRLGCKLSLAGERHEEERLLFSLLLDGSPSKLFLCFPRSDAEGRSQSPSHFVSTVAAMLHKSEEKRSALEVAVEKQGIHVPRSPLARLKQIPAAALTCADVKMLGAVQGVPAKDSRFLKSALVHIDEVDRNDGIGMRDGLVIIAGEIVKRKLADGIGPTILETAATCPHQFYCREILRVFYPEESEEDATPLQMGTLYDAVLTEFHKRYAAGHEWRRLLDEIVVSEFEKLEGKIAAGSPAAREALLEQSKKVLGHFVEFLEATGSLKGKAIAQMEVFGELSGIERIKFRGRIDRATVNGKSAFLVDYKRSFGSYDKKLVDLAAKCRKIQAPVYFQLASTTYDVSEVIFYSIRDVYRYNVEDIVHDQFPRLKDCEKRAAAEELEKAQDAIADAIDGVALNIERGGFFIRPDPGDHGHCGFCNYAPACRRRSVRTVWRALYSPRTQEFHSVVGKP